jgi:Spy/CpxP family protein refolding chaperone
LAPVVEGQEEGAEPDRALTPEQRQNLRERLRERRQEMRERRQQGGQ